jgi:hypothetical protein
VKLLAPVCAALALTLLAPTDARAAEFRDVRDDFWIDVEQPGAPACVTFPVARQDAVECDGVIVDERPGEVGPRRELVGAAVLRATTWGYRVRIVREVPELPIEWDDAVARLVATTSGLSLAPGAVRTGGPQTDFKPVAGLTAVRFRDSYRSEGEHFHSVEYLIPSRHALYHLMFLSSEDRKDEVAAAAERLVARVRVMPPKQPGAPLWMTIAIAVGCIAVFGGGTGMLLTRALSTKRRKLREEMAWPSVRGERPL